MNELVSIIMPSYNTGGFIAESIQSVIEQTYSNWELIIVDDCSTDNTDEVVAQFDDSRIRYIKNEINSGAAVSRNRALREAKGKWIAFLDSDDLWLPEKLERQISFMERNNYKFTYTDYCIVAPDGELVKAAFTAPNKVGKCKMYQYCWFSTITVIYDREAVGLIQIADIKKNNDYAMWLEVIEETDAHRFAECLSIYCKREGSISSGSKLKLIKWHYKLFRHAVQKSCISAAVLTMQNLFFGIVRKLVYKRKLKGEEERVIVSKINW